MMNRLVRNKHTLAVACMCTFVVLSGPNRIYAAATGPNETLSLFVGATTSVAPTGAGVMLGIHNKSTWLSATYVPPIDQDFDHGLLFTINHSVKKLDGTNGTTNIGIGVGGGKYQSRSQGHINGDRNSMNGHVFVALPLWAVTAVTEIGVTHEFGGSSAILPHVTLALALGF